MENQTLGSDPNPETSKKKLVLLGILVLLALTGTVAYMAGTKNNSNYITPESTTSLSDTKTPQPQSSDTIATNATPIKTRTYFANRSHRKYSLIDVITGAIKDFTPEGYTVSNPHSYPQFPSYLALEKDNQMYSYNIVTKDIKRVSLEPLKSGQQFRLHPSFSEKHKLYLEVVDAKETDLGLGQVTSSKPYFYDFSTNQLTSVQDSNIPNGKNASCYQYDSKYTRFFRWQCGEGIGSATPLTVYDYTAKTLKEVVAGEELKVETSNDGEFVVTTYSAGDGRGKSYIEKITRVKTDKNITKEDYTVSDKVKLETADTNYSAIFIEGKNLLAMGGSQSITLLGYNSAKQVYTAKILPEPDIYANFIFTDGDKLYYKSNDKIKIVNLTSKEVEKSFTIKSDEEVTLISLPE